MFIKYNCTVYFFGASAKLTFSRYRRCQVLIPAMGMSRCYSLMKCLLIIFNIIFLMVGCGACGFAAWALYDGRGSESAAGRAGLLALGAWAAALSVGSLAALCGAVRHSASLLAAAFALLALSGVAEGAAAWWGAAHLPQLRGALRDSLARAVRHDYGHVAARTDILDAIQHGLECCGAEGVRDWQHSAWARAAGQAGGGGGREAPAAAARAALDLSVSAAPQYYRVPASCCASADAVECEVARRVPAASGGAGGGGGGGALHARGCGPQVEAALARAARLPLALGGALLAAHGAALLLTLALCLRAHPVAHYKE